MQFVSRLMAVMAVWALLVSPLCADTIPSRYASDSDAHRKVTHRLCELGVEANAAAAKAGRLTEEEALYFASDGRRIQTVGQEMWAGQSDNLWWEWVFGIVALVGVFFAIYIIVYAND